LTPTTFLDPSVRAITAAVGLLKN